MKHRLILSALLAALVACEGQLDPTAGSSIISIADGDTTANGVLNGTVFGAEYGPNWDTLTAPLSGVTVEIYQRTAADTMLMAPLLLDTFPLDTIPHDTIPVDTLPVDTIPVDTIIVDSIPDDPLPWTLVLRGSAVTDAEGRFSVTGIPAGQYVIFIKPAAGSRWAESSGWTFVSDGDATSAGTFHLWPKVGTGMD